MLLLHIDESRRTKSIMMSKGGFVRVLSREANLPITARSTLVSFVRADMLH
jgi:hypothetical protein